MPFCNDFVLLESFASFLFLLRFLLVRHEHLVFILNIKQSIVKPF